jgi:hypothetical protein
MVNEEHDDWDVHLPMVELAVNSAVQASSGVSPFKMTYGREAALPLDVQLGTEVATAPNPTALKLVTRMQKVWKEATTKLEAAKSRQKKNADRKRSEEEFKVGDKVLLSTEHIKLVGAKELQRSVKFGAKFIGPFPIEKVVNANAYKLTLPPKFGMHSTVNISQLRRFVDGQQRFPDREVEDWRPDGIKVVRDANGQLEFEVEKVLAQRGTERRRQYLVKWKGYPLYEATWEAAESLGNAKAKLKQFLDSVGKGEEERLQQLTCIFKGVESETGERFKRKGLRVRFKETGELIL